MTSVDLHSLKCYSMMLLVNIVRCRLPSGYKRGGNFMQCAGENDEAYCQKNSACKCFIVIVTKKVVPVFPLHG